MEGRYWEKRSEKRKRRPQTMVEGVGEVLDVLLSAILQEARWLKDADRSSSHRCY